MDKMINKKDFIAKYSEEAYGEHLAQNRAYHKIHKEEDNARTRKYQEEHPEQARANDQEACRKGGKRYNKMLAYSRTGIPGDKRRIRRKHRYMWN